MDGNNLNTTSQYAESVMTTSSHDFQPVKLIILSELSTREKERYYRLLLLNNAKFRRDAYGRYVGNVRLLAPGIRKVNVNVDGSEKKKKDTSNYALIFQERLMKLRTEGFIEVNLQGLNNSTEFDYNSYPRFTALIAFHGETVRPKLRPLSWVMKYIEDIYDQRFAHERHDVERDTEETSSFDLILLIFPVFVVRKLGTNVGLKSLVDQTCWDLLYSLHLYRRDYLEVETFARFLQEFYDHDDLLFYLYVRSVIAKVLHITFKSRWMKLDGPGRQAKSLWMSYREACHVAKVVFGNDNEEMYREFMSLVTPQMVGSKGDTTDSRRIDITEYLHLSVVGYHQSQARNNPNNGNERFLVPLPGQTAPIEPVPLPPSAMGMSEAGGDGNWDGQQNDNDYIMDENGQYYDNDGNPINPMMTAGTGAAVGRELEAEEIENHHQRPHQQRSRGPSNAYEQENQLAEAYDLQHHLGNDGMGGDEYGNGLIDAQEDFDDGGNNGYDNGNYDQNYFQQYYENNAKNPNNVGGDYYYDAYPPQQQPQRGGGGGGGDYMGNPYNQSDNNTARTSNTSANDSNSASGAHDNMENAFEDLQQGREQEFMTQLLSPIANNVPPNVYMFADSALREQLHETVMGMLQERPIHDLESLDAALLEILQLDELRYDMEGLRDEIVQQLLNSS